MPKIPELKKDGWTDWHTAVFEKDLPFLRKRKEEIDSDSPSLSSLVVLDARGPPLLII